MRLDWRYLLVCLLVGVAVCSVVGAAGGAARALGAGGGGSAGAVAATLLAAGMAGLLMGAALGCVLGALSGLAATVAVGGRTDPRTVARRAGLAVAATYLVLLVVLAGLADGTGWSAPTALAWVGVVVPTVLAGWGAARGAREVPGL